MPLRDWTGISGWDGVHQVWIVELLYWIKPRLPPGYRAYIGTTPTFAIGAPAPEQPDVGVRNVTQESGPQAPPTEPPTAGESSDEPEWKSPLPRSREKRRYSSSTRTDSSRPSS